MNYNETNQKATQAQLKTHNLQMLLQAIYSGEANNRAALAKQTNLTKTTVSALVDELMEDGYLVETGVGHLTEGPGKPVRLLQFVPTARQVIGLSIGSQKIEGVLATLDGRVSVYHSHPVEDLNGEDAVELVAEVINGLAIQRSSELLCIGIGSEGLFESQDGSILTFPPLGWQSLDLQQILTEQQGIPVYLASSTRLAAIGQYAFGSGSRATDLAVILVSDSVGIGFALNRGSYDSGQNIGYFRLKAKADTLESALSWAAIKQRTLALRDQFGSSLLPQNGLTYLHIRYAAAQGDRAALVVYDELAERLAGVVSWIIALHHPEHLSLSGQIADLGPLLLQEIRTKAADSIPADLIAATTFSLDNSADLISVGAVAYALRHELGII